MTIRREIKAALIELGPLKSIGLIIVGTLLWLAIAGSIAQNLADLFAGRWVP